LHSGEAVGAAAPWSHAVLRGPGMVTAWSTTRRLPPNNGGSSQVVSRLALRSRLFTAMHMTFGYKTVLAGVSVLVCA